MILKLLLNALIECNIYKNIEEYNPNKKRKIFIVFDDMVSYMLSDKKLNPIVTELFFTVRKLNIYLIFIPQSYVALPKNIRINSKYYFIMKIPNKQELQKIACNHSSGINIKDFMNLYKKFTAKPYPFLVTGAALHQMVSEVSEIVF